MLKLSGNIAHPPCGVGHTSPVLPGLLFLRFLFLHVLFLVRR